jgi:hypothetical protein
MDIIMIYGEITEAGHLVNISYTKPEQRITTNTVVELVKMPDTDLLEKSMVYDAATKTAILDDVADAKRIESERKEEILQLIRRKNEINEAVSTYGLDYTEELSEIEERLTQLTN